MIRSTGILVVELVILFVVVAAGVHLLQRRLGPERLRTWMGGPPLVAAIKGIAVGFVTPFCTYSAIPLLVGFRRAGVPPAGYVAFIVAAPVLDPILFGALVVIVGVDVAVAYMAVAFTAALTLALLAQRLGLERHLKPLPDAARVLVPAGGARSGVGCSAASDETPESSVPWRGMRDEVASAAAAASGMLRAFGPLLMLGVAIGVTIELLVPAEAAAELTGGNPVMSVPVAAALGTPLYFNTELFVPIANSLHGAGVGVGAIVALTISGAGANLPEFVILGRLARPGVIVVLAGYVFAIAVIGGFLAHVIAA